MNTLKLFFLAVLESVQFGRQVIRYALIFVSAFFGERASLGCGMVAMRRQLTFYEESIPPEETALPSVSPGVSPFMGVAVAVWSGWQSAAGLMKRKTVRKWHEDAFLQCGAGNPDAKEAVQPSARRCEH